MPQSRIVGFKRRRTDFAFGEKLAKCGVSTDEFHCDGCSSFSEAKSYLRKGRILTDVIAGKTSSNSKSRRESLFIRSLLTEHPALTPEPRIGSNIAKAVIAAV